jgi:hypothetical protein
VGSNTYLVSFRRSHVAIAPTTAAISKNSGCALLNTPIYQPHRDYIQYTAKHYSAVLGYQGRSYKAPSTITMRSLVQPYCGSASYEIATSKVSLSTTDKATSKQLKGHCPSTAVFLRTEEVLKCAHSIAS